MVRSAQVTHIADDTWSAKVKQVGVALLGAIALLMLLWFSAYADGYEL